MRNVKKITKGQGLLSVMDMDGHTDAMQTK